MQGREQPSLSLSKGPSAGSAPPTTRPDPKSSHPDPGRQARAPDFHPATPRCPTGMPVLARHPLTPSPLAPSQQRPHHSPQSSHVGEMRSTDAPRPPGRFETRRGPAPCPSSQLIGPGPASPSRRGSDWLLALAAVRLALRFAGSSPFMPGTPAGWVPRASAPLCPRVPPWPWAPPPGQPGPSSNHRASGWCRWAGWRRGRAPGLPSRSAWKVQGFCHEEFPWRFCFKLPSRPSAVLRQSAALRCSPHSPSTSCP